MSLKIARPDIRSRYPISRDSTSNHHGRSCCEAIRKALGFLSRQKDSNQFHHGKELGLIISQQAQQLKTIR
ncbi:hypothetical protein [Candidatus Nitronereus thalassa]|uniref:Uncharacterized protein n=1 Tax=Candidatus Nitronereus thalassa TaxID=3020898 RepID=A0ABU3KDG3_9BACT|nr:hypothetical protein [Candidatus Nitronereus thalassa]MDT7044278.1 hypothetical protein [Candidatus Nitronereus thalassa]